MLQRRSAGQARLLATLASAILAVTGCSSGQPTARPRDPIPSASGTPGATSAAPSPSSPAEPSPSQTSTSPASTAPGATASATIEPSPAASPSPSGPAGPVSATWTRLQPTGEAPAAREDHTWTVDGDGRTAFLFGGRSGAKAFDDLWAYDLTTDAWSRVQPQGEGPAARFGHTASWVPGVGLVVWSGQAGAAFFDDLWAFDPVGTSWRKLTSGGGVPAKRYGSCAALGPDGRLWISHGFTDSGRFFDTRAYDFGTGTWTDLTPAAGQPVERCLHDCWWTAGGKLLLYAGQTTGVAALGDLWSLTPDAAGSGGATWEELPKPALRARQLYAQTQLADQVYVFGGSDPDGKKLDDLWHLDPMELAWTQLSGTEPPSGRAGATLIGDEVRHRMLLWGGKTNDGALDDAWELKLAVQG